MDEGWDGAVVADALVEVLLRIPPSPRRRLRLVCRHWRDVIDEHLPAPRAHAKILALVREPWCSGSRVSASAVNNAYVLDAGLREGRVCRGRELDLLGFADGAGAGIVGSCNGLVCLRRACGDLAVVNPATRQRLVVPPATRKSSQAGAAAYSFAFHPETGLYKIVHVPGAGPGGGVFDAVRVLTLGDVSWRATPAIGYNGRHEFGVVSVGGATYWVSKDATLVVAFDLKDERVAFVKMLPVPLSLNDEVLVRTFRLADIAGRLGFTVRRDEETTPKTEVWVLEGGGEDLTWIRQYVIDSGQVKTTYTIPSPHFVHGERLLIQRWDIVERKTTLYAHRPRKEKFPRCEVVRVTDPEQRTAVAKFDGYMYERVPTFCHVETMEPVIDFGYTCHALEWSFGSKVTLDVGR